MLIDTKIINGITVKIYHDDYAENPREWDSLGTIYYCSTKYLLGDKWLPAESIRLLENKKNIWFPVYAYIHSNISLSLNPFSCPWDSGQSGIILTTKEKVREYMQCKKITKKVIQAVRINLQRELLTFSEYLNGEVYRLETETDSIGGVYASDINYYCQEIVGMIAA
jgi:hypothetical protein